MSEFKSFGKWEIFVFIADPIVMTTKTTTTTQMQSEIVI